ncbi:NAD-P-binding protein [Calocera viscosa TUFC12733]|uniref:NAD-P-binding protein n=1 Tax=Calocera viscosa (strain TUFC12733) TaxID=1330018 RepID=A0A167QXK0_CALVF|nr:NAD-P-binding protein [Calocera viscosa TUFC12733]
MSNLVFPSTADQDLPVTQHHDIYPGIDPSKFQASLTGKVVFVTGASRGIGEATARAFAQSGATVFLAARKTATLESVKAGILKDFPGAKVAYHVADVTKPESVKAAVDACIAAFGKIDIVVSNSGAVEDILRKLAYTVNGGILGQVLSARMTKVQSLNNVQEVNVQGNFNVAHYTLPHLSKTHGYLIFVSSIGAQYITPGLSGYQSTKHVLNRLVEFIVAEGDGTVKVFSLHPGGIKTEMSMSGGPDVAQYLIDDVKLPAWTMVRLVHGEEDYLSGRYISSNWDMDEVLTKWKGPILRDDALKNRLTMPREL